MWSMVAQSSKGLRCCGSSCCTRPKLCSRKQARAWGLGAVDQYASQLHDTRWPLASGVVLQEAARWCGRTGGLVPNPTTNERPELPRQ